MKQLIIFLFILKTASLFGQNDTIYAFEKLDKEPAFKGGKDEFVQFIQNNLVYPQKAKNNKTEGYVWVQFVIEKNGELTNVKIVKSLDTACDEEVIKMIKKMPKWIPGEKNNQVVRTYFNLPIKFSLPH